MDGVYEVAHTLPIHPDELSRYVYAGPRGIYPHNQWLELWVELGALGAALGLVFALLVLRRIGRLPEAIRPFAFAAFASAMTVASVDYEVVTDSWWFCAGGERGAVRHAWPVPSRAVPPAG